MRRQKTRRYDTIFEGNTYKSWKNSFITQILLNALFCGSFTVAVAASGQTLNRVQNNTRFHFTFIEWFLFWLILPVFNWIFLLLFEFSPAAAWYQPPSPHTYTLWFQSRKMTDDSPQRNCARVGEYFFFVWCYCYFFFWWFLSSYIYTFLHISFNTLSRWISCFSNNIYTYFS